MSKKFFKLSLRCWVAVLSIIVGAQVLSWNWVSHNESERLHRFDQTTIASPKKTTRNIQAPSLAILVAGSSQRLLFNSTVHHVIKPLLKRRQARTVDYFCIVTLQSGPAFRQDSGYMGHLSYDPLLVKALTHQAAKKNSGTSGEVQAVHDAVQDVMVDAINGVSMSDGDAHLRSLRVLSSPLEDGAILEEMRTKLKRKAAGTPDTMFDVFPMKDNRPKALKRTQAGNKNMARLFLALEALWDNELIPMEKALGQRYDYVLIARDDTLWLDDLDLEKLLATNPLADAYILSCDARDPAMLSPEINDHGVLIKRNKAEVLGKYLTTMVRTDLEVCHKSAEQWVGNDRGCNSEMILKHVLKVHDITVQLVPQSLLPFERAVVIEHVDGKKEYCFHKFCQSKEAPLKLPPEMRRCKDISFD